MEEGKGWDGMERVIKLRLASFRIRLPHRTRDDDDDESVAVRYAVYILFCFLYSVLTILYASASSRYKFDHFPALRSPLRLHGASSAQSAFYLIAI